VNLAPNTQSERLVEFLKRTPLNKSVHKVLNSINLSGKVDGDMRLVLLLSDVSFKATTTINQFHPKNTLVIVSLIVRIDTNVK
jgi:uncharacterized protein YhdP